MAPDEQPAEPPKKRALPFKRTVARRQQSVADPAKEADDSDLDLFRHSKEVFPEVLREAEEQGQKQHDRKRRKVSMDKSPAPSNREPSLSSDEHPSLHRRSTTLDESDDDIIMDVKGKGKEIIRATRTTAPRTPSRRTSSRTPVPKRASSRTPSSRRNTPRNRAHSPTSDATVVDDDDDDDDVIPIATPPRRRTSNAHPTPRRAPLKTDSDSDSSPVEINPFADSETESTTNPAESQPDFSEWIAKARELQAAQSQQAVVNVFMTSRVPGADTRPFLAKRRLNQDVQLLLRVWIAEQIRQGVRVPDDVAAGLFLTWKGNKIYGLSTLASLGVQVDAQGQLRGNEGEGYVRGGLLLEVWDEETYADYLESRGRERALTLGEVEDGDSMGAESEEEAPTPVQQKKKGIRIVVKAKDREPLKLMTREDTTVEVIIEAFRAQRGIGPEWEVAVYFDGERLDDDSLVKDADIDPDEANQLEVHLKPRSG